MPVRMDERQKIRDDLARRLTMRSLATDEQARDAIDERMREIEDPLAEMEQEPDAIAGAGVSTAGQYGGAGRMSDIQPRSKPAPVETAPRFA